MNPVLNEWLNLLFRWVHVVAGVMWIGHLYYFNFVNSQVVKTYDADSKKKVLPEVMPRALFWFRWGALWTGVSGVLLLGVVVYMGGVLSNPDQPFAANAALGALVSLLFIFGAFFAYDLLWKSPLAKNEMTGAIVSFVLLAALVFVYSRLFSGRAVYIQTGSTLGMLMLMNVWMRIWPSQKKIIAGVKGTAPAPDPSVAALAGLRSKHNTYMSVPLLVMMISNHYPGVYGNDLGWATLLVLVLVGWGATKLLYTKSASAAPAQF